MKKKKPKCRKWLYVILIIGILLALIYPFATQYYYRNENNKHIRFFEKNAESLKNREIVRRLELARSYNKNLDFSRISNPDKYNRRGDYGDMLRLGNQIGYIEIPKLDLNLPIYTGTGDSVLRKGAGHIEGTALPIGEKNTHSALMVRRGLRTTGLFTNLKKINKGNLFCIRNLETRLTYEVDKVITVDGSDFNPDLLRTREDKDYVTILTTPSYIRNNKKLLIRGHRVNYIASIEYDFPRRTLFGIDYKDLIMFELPIAFIVMNILIYYILEANKRKKKLEMLERESNR